MVQAFAAILAKAASGKAVLESLDRLALLCMVIAGIQLVILISSFGWLVFGRYVLNDTPTWVEQLSLVLVVWITFLGGAAGVWHNSHLAVDFLRDALPRVPRRVLHWTAISMTLTFGIFMAWQGMELTQKTWPRRIPMLDIAEGWRALPMVIFGILAVVFSLAQLIASIAKDPSCDTDGVET